MNRTFAAAVLAAATAFVSPCFAQVTPDKTDVKAEAKAQADVPVKVVVLFSSGVGYFEHAGSVKGTTSTELRFKTQQINDILKSLLLQDMNGGKVTTVVYPSQDPIEKTLRSFQVDITSDPSLAQLLSQLRGAKVEVTLGGDILKGTILGVEKKPKAVGDKGQIEVPVLNLISGGTIRSVELNEAKKIELEDPQLKEELDKALTALSQARDQDKKPVTINFSGEGERQVRIGYVVETPIWKTSYRLVLPGEAKDKPKLVGWAIVENQTDNDWNNIQLNLVSGRPISFIQDLYRPLYVPRPVVQPELYASLRPQTYEAGMARELADDRRAETEQLGKQVESLKKADASGRYRGAAANAPAKMPNQNGAFAGESFGLAGAVPADEKAAEYKRASDFSASVSSIASASKVGELFQYTVGNVSLPRQRSAMIPIVTDEVEVEKVSIYNPTVLPRNPLNGARVKNTTGKHLLQGPVTVIEGSAYAGDARIDNVPPTQERLLSYGIDLQVLVDGTKQEQTDVIQAGKIVKGVLHLTRKLVHSHTYSAESKSDKDKTLIIEHPLRSGWKLVEPEKASEKTDTLYRFKQSLAANKSASLKVVEELVTGEQIALFSTDVGALDFYSKTDRIPKNVRDVLTTAISKKNEMTDTQREIDQRRAKIQEITTEQNRIRENIKTVDRTSDYATRLLKKLNDQETLIETQQAEVKTLTEKLNQQRAELEKYLNDTTLE